MKRNHPGARCDVSGKELFMQFLRLRTLSFYFAVLTTVLIAGVVSSMAQASYTAQIRGTVSDTSGAVMAGAKVTITEDATNISKSVNTDGSGHYILPSLRPATYTLKVAHSGFEAILQKNVVLGVGLQTTLDFMLKPSSANVEVQVVDTAPLLDSSSASLGTDVTNEFVSRIPLVNRDITQLVYLSAGVTSLNNADAYPYGTNFSSNGQRYGSAEVRLDGNLVTGPEQGEGATSNVSYVPSGEVVQEFKVQNNSFSAEFGNNGGTVVNMVMKSGTNQFHGSGWWFGQRTSLNANDFFSNRDGIPKTDSTRDQYGFSIGGPIWKNKTFFLFDLERVRQNFKDLVSARVPTALERQGDFSQSTIFDENGDLVPVSVFNPFDLTCTGTGTSRTCTRNPFSTPNVIPQNIIDPVGQALVNAYPMPTGEIDPATQTNFNMARVISSPNTQFDIKLDHQFSDKFHLMGRYSQNYSDYTEPNFFYDGYTSFTHTRNAGLEFTWTLNPKVLWTSRFGLERYYMSNKSDGTDPTQFGLPALLVQANNIKRMPNMNVDDFQPLNSQCCIETINGHTQLIYSSSMTLVSGRHVFKFGGEQRPFFNNFYQPDYATGIFNFPRTMTSSDLFGSNSAEGSGLAAMLLGFPSDGQVNIKYAVANKSMDTAFYFQDDWRVTDKLTLNLGLRYEWSTPYTERHNRIQFSDFNADSGISVDLSSGDPALQALGLGPTELKGTTRFADGSMRHIPVDRNNFGPRVGFAYQVGKDTVLRGGAGMFYGLSSATNFQYSGTSFRKDAIFHFSLDGGETQYATMTNLFPQLPPNTLPQPQGTTYGKLAEWGFYNANDLGTATDRNPEIYQWNLGVQHLFPFGVVVSADYSGNRSTHLPWGGATRNRDILPDSVRQQLVAQLGPGDADNSPVSDYLSTLVTNPFQSLFQGPNAIFNEPESIYNNDEIPLVNLLRKYPQFDSDFEALPLLAASSWYHGFLVRFQKRPSHGLSFEGNYTWSKATDYSSFGANYWIYFGGSGLGNPQDLNNLKAEHSIGANDTPQRFVLATVYDLPFGRHRHFGGEINRALDAVVGGWSVNALLTLQSGQPIPFAMANSRFIDGLQRPNLLCNATSGASMHDIAFSNDPGANYFNQACFGDPGDQVAGDAPRFSANARGQGVKNLDMGFFKEFAVRENMKLQLRAEFFNFTNSVRFATPYSAFGDSSFGLVTSQANSPRRTQVAVRFEF
jgi:Carboxypeptidase regulatory-like domain/TonB dependent receptor